MEEEICRIVEKALALKPGSVKVNDGIDTLKEWDSLGFLSILSALEQRFGSKVSDVEALSSATSVGHIIEIFKSEKII